MSDYVDEMKPIEPALAHGFFANFVGWLVAFLLERISHLVANDGLSFLTGFPDDLRAMYFFPLMYNYVGFGTIGIALILLMRSGRRLRLCWVPILWCIVTVVFYLMTVMIPHGFGMIRLVWWPVLTGLVGGFIFWLLEVRDILSVAACFLIPLVVHVLIWLLVYG